MTAPSIVGTSQPVYESKVNQMQPSFQFRTIACLSTFIAGVAFACQSESASNPDSCFVQEGDQTCAEIYGDERPYCAVQGESCDLDTTHHGCVAEAPPDECYSPCGEDADCSPNADEQGDGDGDPADDDGTTDDDTTEDGTTGDGDGDPGPVCGDGFLDDDEECDDGNTINDDDCSNECQAATCGDGIVQAAFGETCDDGDTVGGDGCSSNCLLPGTLIWSRYSDLPNAVGVAVAVAGDGTIGVIAQSSGLGTRILGLNPEGDTLWTKDAPPQASSIATGPSNEFVTGGTVDDKGQVWSFDPGGDLAWVAQIPGAPVSEILAVAVDGAGSVVSVGSGYSLGMRLRHSSTGEKQFSQTTNGTPTLNRVAAAADGSYWVLRETPRVIDHYDSNDELVWTSGNVVPLAAQYQNIAADKAGNTYLISDAGDDYESFALTKFTPDGGTWWTSYHDSWALEAALSVTTLLNGAIVVGMTDGDGDSEDAGTDALVSWFGADGTLMQDFVYDGEQDDDFDIFMDVASAPDGNLIVVGVHQVMGSDNQLWIAKIAM